MMMTIELLDRDGDDEYDLKNIIIIIIVIVIVIVFQGHHLAVELLSQQVVVEQMVAVDLSVVMVVTVVLQVLQQLRWSKHLYLIHLIIYLFIHLFTHLPINLFNHPSIYYIIPYMLFIKLSAVCILTSIYPTFYIFLHPHIHAPINPCIHLSIYLCMIYLFIYLSYLSMHLSIDSFTMLLCRTNRYELWFTAE